MGDTRKKVLIITYYWPPASGPGVQRWLKFAKFLPALGWEPIILTPKNGSYPNVDPTLLDDVPGGLRVIYTKTVEPFSIYNRLTGQSGKGNSSPVGMMGLKKTKNPIKRMAKYLRANWFIPDARKGWVPFATRAAYDLIAKEDVAAIITTGPPHSTHLIGLRLKAQLHLPWIADFRDPWVDIYYNAFLPRTKATQRRDKHLQDKVLSTADSVITVSDGLTEKFRQTAHQITTIYNGYDAHDFGGTPSPPENQFTIRYVGNLKANQNPLVLWRVLQQLCKELAGFRDRFQLHITGNIDPTVEASIHRHQLNKHLHLEGFVPHDEAIKRMQTASVLLFIIPDTLGNEVILTGKLFEYLASATPMLAIGPPAGNAAQLLADCKRTPMIAYEDETTMKRQIKGWFTQFQQGGVPKHPGQEHLKYSREGLTHKLAQLLNTLS